MRETNNITNLSQNWESNSLFSRGGLKPQSPPEFTPMSANRDYSIDIDFLKYADWCLERQFHRDTRALGGLTKIVTMLIAI